MRARRLLLGLVLALPGVVRGGETEPDETVLLPPWDVAEPADGSRASGREDVSGFTPGSASVVTGGAWDDRSIGTLGEALRGVPGLIAQESFGGFEPPRLSIRGSGLNSAPTARGIALAADGLPLGRSDGSFQTALFDPQLFAEVDVSRGTAQAAAAPAALGGVLNAAGGAPGGRFHLDAGDFQEIHSFFSADAGGAGAGASVAGSYASRDGWRPHGAQERRAWNVRAWRQVTPSTRATVSFYGARAWYEVPGPLTLADALARPRSVSAAVARDQPRRDSSLAHLAGRMESVLPDGSLAAGVSLQRLRDDFRQLQANGESDSTSNDLSGRVALSKKIELAGLEHRFEARGSFSLGLNSTDRYLNASGVRGAEFARVGLRGGSGAVSIEDLVRLRPQVALFAGLNGTWSRRGAADWSGAVGSGLLAGDRRDHGIAPRAGAIWTPRPGVRFYADVSGGREAPVFDDLLAVSGVYPNLVLRRRDLDAQRATTVEAGGRGRLGPLTWNVALYHAWWRDEILQLADAAGQPRGSVNAGRTIHRGAEAALRWLLRDKNGSRLGVAAACSWNDFRFDADPMFGSNRLAGAPPCTGSAEILHETARGCFAAAETTWAAGRTPVDQANRLSYGGAVLFGARVGWHWTERLTLYLAGRNLFDRRHVASTAGVLDIARNPAATAIFLPGEGRGFTGGLECRW